MLHTFVYNIMYALWNIVYLIQMYNYLKNPNVQLLDKKGKIIIRLLDLLVLKCESCQCTDGQKSKVSMIITGNKTY